MHIFVLTREDISLGNCHLQKVSYCKNVKQPSIGLQSLHQMLRKRKPFCFYASGKTLSSW